ncbi:MAG: hypothetical protein MJZ37_06380 [Bacilli bacterium]|nr:hypothetical protein [Bacilli bacterium]
MARYIDIDKYKNFGCGNFFGDCQLIKKDFSCIDCYYSDGGKEDVVPTIHCSDCKHYERDANICLNEKVDFIVYFNETLKPTEHFCSLAEKRSDFMTIKECEERKTVYEKYLKMQEFRIEPEDIPLIRLAIIRSLAIEKFNILDLKTSEIVEE